jgi:LysR family hca operon transcriptional activator
MVKIITVQFQRSRLPRRRLNDGWWLEQPPARLPSSLSQSAACRSPSPNPATSPSISRPHLAIKPDHIAENISVAISFVASTRGITLLPLYAQNLLPKTVVSRPIRGTPPMIDLVIGYNEANTSPLLKFLLSKVDELKFRVSKNDGR